MNNPILSLVNWLKAGGKPRMIYAGLFTVSILITAYLVFGGGPSNTLVESQAGYAGPNLLDLTVKLLGVLLLIIGGAVVLRRWQGAKSATLNRQLKVMETVRLTPRQSLHVVKAGGRFLLLGATDQNISMLSALEIDEAALPQASQQPVIDFNAVLNSLASRSSTPDKTSQAG